MIHARRTVFKVRRGRRFGSRRLRGILFFESGGLETRMNLRGSIRGSDDAVGRRPSVPGQWLHAVLALGLLTGVVSPLDAGGGDGPEFCLLHVEPFETFNAPGDVVDPRFSIEWCESGGAVVPSGFCPTGGAYRLDPGDRLVARVAAVESCGRIRISFLASSLFDTWSRLEIGPATAECRLPVT